MASGFSCLFFMVERKSTATNSAVVSRTHKTCFVNVCCSRSFCLLLAVLVLQNSRLYLFRRSSCESHLLTVEHSESNRY